MIEQRLEFVNLNAVLGSFSRLERGLEILRPLWERFGKEFYAEEKALFDRQPWTPLSPAYAERKRKAVGDKPILRLTDALYESFTQQGSAGNIHRISNLDAEFGSSDFKAKLHASGTSRMPARDPLAEPDIDQYQTLAGEYLGDLLQRAGFN